MTTLEIFKEICKIPHCSYNAQALKTYLQEFAKRYDYEVECDKAGNILCHKIGSNITLQSHYDMVCIGEYKEMKLYEKEIEGNKWLCAKDSTLGADNGIGIALTLKMMAEGKRVDALFTADEEVGLEGARALELKVQTPYLLNIDSEDEGVVTLGCAGGVDVKVLIPITRVTKIGTSREVEFSGEEFLGGHSGVDIHLNIKNAIKELSFFLECNFMSIEGGERRNSIAKRARAEVYISEGEEEVVVIKNSKAIITALKVFTHGVREYNSELDIVETSINLAMIKTHKDFVEINLSLRSMDDEKLKALLKETRDYFEGMLEGSIVSDEGYYAPWKPVENEFVKLVVTANEKVFEKVTLGGIHAGLECGILGEKMPDLQMASIGPNIIYPHSTREAVEIASVERIEKVLMFLAESLN